MEKENYDPYAFIAFLLSLCSSLNLQALHAGGVRDEVWTLVWAGLPGDLKGFLRILNAVLKGTGRHWQVLGSKLLCQIYNLKATSGYSVGDELE